MRMEANKVPFRDASPPRHAVTFSQGDESMGLDAFSHWRELRGVLPLAPNSQVPEQSPRSRRTLGFSSHFPPKCHTLYHKCSSMIAVARPITQVVFVAGETNGGDGVFDIRFFATNYGYGTARIRGHGTTMPICRDSVHCRPERGPGVTFRNICAPDMMIRPGSVPRADGRLPTGFMQLSSLPRPTNPLLGKRQDRYTWAVAQALRKDAQVGISISTSCNLLRDTFAEALFVAARHRSIWRHQAVACLHRACLCLPTGS